MDTSWHVFAVGGALLVALAGLLYRAAPFVLTRPMWRVVRLAEIRATLERHRAVTPVHLAITLLGDPDVAAALERRGVSLERLHDDLAALIAPPGDAEQRNVDPMPAPTMSLLTAARGGRMAAASSMQVLRAVVQLDDPSLREVLRRHHVDASVLSTSAGTAHAQSGALPIDAGVYRTPSVAECEVVLWDDRKTKHAFVLALAREAFCLHDAQANRLVLSVEREGFAVAGRYSREEAERVAEVATQRARDEGFPLRITVRRVGEAPEPRRHARRSRRS